MWIGIRNTGIFVAAFAVVGASAYLILVLGINRYTLPDWAVALDYFGVTVVGAMLLWWVYGLPGKGWHKRLADSSGEWAEDPDITVFDRIDAGLTTLLDRGALRAESRLRLLQCQCHELRAVQQDLRHILLALGARRWEPAP